MLRWSRVATSEIRRLSTSSFNPASVFAPASNDMLVSLSMQHASSARTQLELADELLRKGLLRSSCLVRAFQRIDRRWFSDADVDAAEVYADAALPIISSSGTHHVSSPSMHAIALEALLPNLGDGKKALDIACGSGPMSALMAELGSAVVGVELDVELAEKARSALRQAALEKLVNIQQRDALKTPLALEEVDALFVGVSVEDVPEHWCRLLREGGRMVVPVGAASCEQQLLLLERCGRSDKLTRSVLLRACAFERICDEDALQHRRQKQDPAELRLRERQDAKVALQRWHAEFVAENQRRPSASEIEANATASELLRRYRNKDKH